MVSCKLYAFAVGMLSWRCMLGARLLDEHAVLLFKEAENEFEVLLVCDSASVSGGGANVVSLLGIGSLLW